MTIDEIMREMEELAAKAERFHNARRHCPSPALRDAINRNIDKLNARADELRAILEARDGKAE